MDEEEYLINMVSGMLFYAHDIAFYMGRKMLFPWSKVVTVCLPAPRAGDESLASVWQPIVLTTTQSAREASLMLGQRRRLKYVSANQKFFFQSS